MEQRAIAPNLYNWDETFQRIKNAGQSILGYYFLYAQSYSQQGSDINPSLLSLDRNIADGPFSVDHLTITQLLEKNEDDARLVIQLDRVLQSAQGRDYIEAGVRLDIFQRLNELQISPLPFKILNASYATPSLVGASKAACIDLSHRMSRLKQLISITSETLFEAWRKNHQSTEKNHTYFRHLLAQMLTRELSFAWSDTQKKFPILDNLSFHEAPTTRMKGFTAAVNKQLASELEPLLAPIKRPRTLSNPTLFRSSHHPPISKNNTGTSQPNFVSGANDLETSKGGIVNKPIPRPILPAVVSPRPRTPSNDSISSGSGSPKPSPTSPLPTVTLETETHSENSRSLVSAPIPLKLINCKMEEESLAMKRDP